MDGRTDGQTDVMPVPYNQPVIRWLAKNRLSYITLCEYFYVCSEQYRTYDLRVVTIYQLFTAR